VFSDEVEHKKFKEYTDIHFNENSKKFNISAGHLGQTLVVSGLILAGLAVLNLLVLVVYVSIPYKFQKAKKLV